MTLFILIATAMLIAALAVVLTPLLRGGSAPDPILQARNKVRALDSAFAAGVLSEVEFAQKRAAIGAETLNAIASRPGKPVPTFYLALMVALVLPASAIALYRLLGEPRAVDGTIATVAAAAAAAPGDHGPDMQAAINKLADKLKETPNDAEGWTLLGRAYKATQRFAEGRDALKRAHDLSPGDADITVEYAEAVALATPQHRVAGEARTLLNAALASDPKNERGLWLTGIDESQSGNYDAAIAIWTRLLPLLPRNSEVATSIGKQIAQAQALRDGKPLPADEESTDTSPPIAANSTADTSAANAAPEAANPAGDGAASNTATANGPHIAVKVVLDAKLKSKVQPGDTLFVFAKALNGPPMPLAIARLTAAQLPANVTLTDAMGMLPSMKLSQFPQVVIGARISKSGQAIAQSGDFQVISAPVASTRTEPVELTIDQTVP